MSPVIAAWLARRWFAGSLRCGCELITASHSEIDLERQDQTEHFLIETKPHAVIVAAAKVGGIVANSAFPADFISENIAMPATSFTPATKPA